MKKYYVEAVMGLLRSGMPVAEVLSGLEKVLTKRGHLALRRGILRAVERALGAGSTDTGAMVTVAREADATTYTEAIDQALANVGFDEKSFTTTIDPSVIGGYRVTYNHQQIDRTYKAKLVALYRAIIN